MKFTISGYRYDIHRNDILAATRGVIPKSFKNDGRYRYYIELHGAKYPIKQVIHIAIELPYRNFHAQDAKRILEKLGFSVHSLEMANGIMPVLRTSPKTTVVEGTMKFAITLEQDEDGFMVASVPALPGCHSQGKTEEEAIANIKEAIRGYIASMRRHGEPIPNITDVREVEVAV